jgi:hypothetical protein
MSKPIHDQISDIQRILHGNADYPRRVVNPDPKHRGFDPAEKLPASAEPDVDPDEDAEIDEDEVRPILEEEGEEPEVEE